MAERCVHGIDERFCAICNRAQSGKQTRRATGTTRSSSRPARAAAAPTSKERQRAASDRPTLDDVMRFLNGAQVRATRQAVAQLLGVPPEALAARLGAPRPEASWIVTAENGLPTGYTQNEMHPELVRSSEIITSGLALAMRMAAWTPTPRR